MNTQQLLAHKRAQLGAAAPSRKPALALEIAVLLNSLAAEDAAHDMAQERLDREAGWHGFAPLWEGK